MSLSPLQRLDLQDRLADLLIQRPAAKGLDLLELLEQINEVLILLGYSADEEIKPEPEAPGKPPAGEEPQLVTDFKAGVFSSVPASDFIETLRQIDAYEPEYISLDEVKKGAVAWVNNNPDKFARAA